jgi:deoxyhypusine monooxygenase
MVRHEAAEALGSLAADGTLSILQNFAKDSVRPVRESCEVALDVHDYWTKFNAGESVPLL